MGNLSPDGIPRVVHVGDKRRISYVFLNLDRSGPRNLTNYAAEISYSYWNSTPHVVRAATLDPLNGITIDEQQGNEYPQTGIVIGQFTIFPPDWYMGGAAGSSYIRTSSKSFKFVVHARPV